MQKGYSIINVNGKDLVESKRKADCSLWLNDYLRIKEALLATGTITEISLVLVNPLGERFTWCSERLNYLQTVDGSNNVCQEGE